MVEPGQEEIIEETVNEVTPASTETVPQKRGPGREKGWRKVKPPVEPTVTPVAEESIVGNVVDLDRELAERMSFAPPDLGSNNPAATQTTKIPNDQPRYKVPEFIEEPYAGTVIQRAHTQNIQDPGTVTPENPTGQQNQTVVQEATYDKPVTPAASSQSANSTTKPTPVAKTPTPGQEVKSPAEFKKEVRATADMILKGVQQILPIPFTWTANFNVGKLDNLHIEKKINLNTLIEPPSPVYPNGFTLKDYVVKHNTENAAIFAISDADLDTIRPHLEDVLMEKEVAATPMQRLIGAVIPIVLLNAKNAMERFQLQKMATKAMISEMQRQTDLIAEAIKNGTYVPGQPHQVQYHQTHQQPAQQQTPQPEQQVQQPVQHTAAPEVTNTVSHDTAAPSAQQSAPVHNQSSEANLESSDKKETASAGTAMKIDDYLTQHTTQPAAETEKK